MEHSHRLSIETYQEFYDGEELNPILVQQYHVAGLPGLLLSPRAYRDGDTFECCSQCFSSLKPSKAQVSKKTPKFSIANGFEIGCIPREITTKDANGQDTTINIDEIDDVMCASLSQQHSYAHVCDFFMEEHRSQ